MGMNKAARMMMMGRSDDRHEDKYNSRGERYHRDGEYRRGERYRQDEDRDYHSGNDRDYYDDHERKPYYPKDRREDYGYGDRKEIRAGGTFWMDEPYREKSEFDRKSAEHWVSKMKNEDGTTGAHWNMEQTTAVAKENGVKFEHITDYCWWVTMNMMYSDYYAVAVKHGRSTPEFYADMAKAFLFDKDAKSPRDKISAYYEYVVM